MPLASLESYDISPSRGFLCRFNAADVHLPDDFADVVDAANSLPELLTSGRVRHFLKQLPTPDIKQFIETADDATLRLAMVRYSFLVQSYVWGEEEAPRSLPTCLAVPIWHIAEKLGQQPLLPYSSYVLDNWGLLDPAGEISLDNVYMIQNFLSGMDEAWFVLIHVAIEAHAGNALAEAPTLLGAVQQEDTTTAITSLAKIGKVWEGLNAIFDRMPERCDPYVYFTRVRPYIHGWKDNPALPDGLVYEGVKTLDGKPVAYRGQTGSQSSIVPAMDALLGITHEEDPLRKYLDELHIYRPPAHRKLIDDIRAQSTVRKFVEAGQNAEMKGAYNHIVEQIAAFRTRHLEYAASYINKQGKTATGNDTEVGTGGTPFMRYLKKHRDESRAQLIA